MPAAAAIAPLIAGAGLFTIYPYKSLYSDKLFEIRKINLLIDPAPFEVKLHNGSHSFTTLEKAQEFIDQHLKEKEFNTKLQNIINE